MIRRLLAAVFAALTLQISVARAELPCDMSDASQNKAVVAHDSASDHSAAHAPTLPAPHDHECDDSTDCCIATPCSMAEITAAVVETGDGPVASRALQLASDAPRSRIATPDPPPPKA